MTETVNSGKNRPKPPRTGQFVKGDPRINRKGAPVRGQSWAETIKRITDMTAGEAIAYVGEKSSVGKLLKELPADLPIKDALVFITIINYGRDPNARTLTAIMDRESGKPAQPITGDKDSPLEVIVKYADNNTVAETPPSTTADKE